MVGPEITKDCPCKRPLEGGPMGRVAKTAGRRPAGRAPGPQGSEKTGRVLTGAARGSAEALDFLPGEGEPRFARL